MVISVREYIREDGSSPYKEWFDKLDPIAATKVATALLRIIEIRQEVRALAESYFSVINLPEKARADAYHIALATWHGLDYLVSWNCTHIANGRIRMLIEEINAQNGIRTPIICTPEELMEG